MPRRLLALVAVAVLAGSACGDSSDDAEPPPRGDDGAAASTTVRATDFAFDPTLIEVDPGEDADVTFVNAGNVTHSFTAEDLDVDVEAEPGQEATATFTAPDEDATIEFVCRFHPSQMTGEITVGGGGSGAGSGGGSGGDDAGSEPEPDY
ncbi:MAG TPA: cupredoxin domain-containing protein [Actinomycetota bacterium]|nr:cupredoxin domain-containing protein [Actinomycetota bacterium]